jgi:hypothetical protein
LIQHRTIARWIRTHCNTTERNVFPHILILFQAGIIWAAPPRKMR